MIILDTNVISELMRSPPDTRVHRWFSGQPRSSVYTTSITKAEILYGIALMPEGRRKAALAETAERMFAGAFVSRLLPFDAAAAIRYPEVLLARRRAGRPIETLDAQIAAIAAATGAEVATRNVSDFAGCGVAIVDPWAA
jgi:predicted nucleic acid-binding protein